MLNLNEGDWPNLKWTMNEYKVNHNKGTEIDSFFMQNGLFVDFKFQSSLIYRYEHISFWEDSIQKRFQKAALYKIHYLLKSILWLIVYSFENIWFKNLMKIIKTLNS
jgi:hypothetical protein